MTDTAELNDLVSQARYHGAQVTVTYDGHAFLAEGRKVHSAIRIADRWQGIGSGEMSPLNAAEVLRRANWQALHELCRHDKQPLFCARCAGRH